VPWGRELAFDAVQKQLAGGGVELSVDQLRKGSAERPEETLHRALGLGYGSLTSGGVWLVVDKIRSFLRCLCIAGADDRHVACILHIPYQTPAYCIELNRLRLPAPRSTTAAAPLHPTPPHPTHLRTASALKTKCIS
jgi:hypothetical protein